MIFNIYLITNLLNSKKYVGQTIGSIEKRFSRHCWLCTSKNNMPIAVAIKKYGKQNFKIELLEQVDTLEEANEKEVFWSLYYNTMSPNGYNLKVGGRVYFEMSQETHPFSLNDVKEIINLAREQYWDVDNRGFSSNAEGDWSFKYSTEDEIIQKYQETKVLKIFYE